jgi:hypothetical protein
MRRDISAGRMMRRGLLFRRRKCAMTSPPDVAIIRRGCLLQTSQFAPWISLLRRKYTMDFSSRCRNNTPYFSADRRRNDAGVTMMRRGRFCRRWNDAPEDFSADVGMMRRELLCRRWNDAPEDFSADVRIMRRGYLCRRWILCRRCNSAP